jgi:hypothetical protein
VVEDELLFYSRDHKNIALAVDFNSRTSNVSDIVELDDNLFDMLDISNVPEYLNVNMLSNYKLAEIGIPLKGSNIGSCPQVPVFKICKNMK